MAKAPAHTPQFFNSNGRLQARLTYQGKRDSFSLGVPDSPTNRKHYQIVLDRISLDIRTGEFDPTLDKYRPKHTLKVESRPSVVEDLSLDRLWEKYTDFKRPQLSPSTIAKDFDRVARHIAKFPSVKPIDAIIIRDYLVKNSTVATAKKVLTQISACLDWAVKSRLAIDNPFKGMAADLKSPKGGGTTDDIDPFSIDERDEIVRHFWEENQSYAPLVEFLFRTGCRPSEALPLVWGDISSDFKTIIFERALVEGESGLTVKNSLKTQARRVFPCGGKLSEFLQSIAPPNRTPSLLVFPSPNAKKYIDIHNFANRVWRKALELSNIRYRNLYQTRHTYITFCLDSGMDAKDVAKLVGNSPEMIYRHYAGAKKDLIAPDL